MKKTFLFIGFWFASIVLTAQNLISLKLGSTDITYLAPGDTVYVPIICNEIGPSNIITGAQYTFEMDPSVIYWTGNFTSNFGNPEDWMFFYSGDQMIASSGYGIAINGMTLISFEFIYTGGETPLTWGYTEVFDETFEYYSVTVVGPSCVCDLPDYAVTFHVTAYGEDLEGAIITIGNLWLETDENGMATFSLCDGQYDYTVTKPGYADEEGTFTVVGAPLLIEEEMEVCWDIILHLIDTNGTTITDSALVIVNNDTVWTTNGSAAFCITGDTINYEVYIDGYYPEIGEMILTPGPITVEIIMTPIFYDVSFFVNCCGEPVPDYTFSYQAQTVTTNAEGLAVLYLEAGFYSLEIGGVLVTFTVPDTTYVPVDICGEVSFYVSSGGEPVPETNITIDNETHLTNELGYADFCLLQGTYNYTIENNGYITSEGSVTITNEPIVIEVHLRCEVTVHVVCVESPVDGAVITCSDTTVYTNEEGIGILHLEDGIYIMIILHPDFYPFVWDVIIGGEPIFYEFDLCVGIPAESTIGFLYIFPNPSEGLFLVGNTISGLIPDEIHVTDLTGREVYFEVTINSQTMEIDLIGQPKGMYFVRLQQGQSQWTKKLIIR